MSTDCPVEDLSKTAIFTVDETEEIDAKILSSENNESVLRGTISLGTLDDIFANFKDCMTNVLAGAELPEKGYVTEAFVITPETLK